MGQTRMFRDRVVSMEQTLEGGEKHLELLKMLCREAMPDFEYASHVLDHERDLFVLELKAPDGRRKTVAWTRMVLFDAERLPAITADPAAAVRDRVIGYLKARAARPDIVVTFRHLEEGWVDTPEARPARRRGRRGGRGGKAATLPQAARGGPDRPGERPPADRSGGRESGRPGGPVPAGRQPGLPGGGGRAPAPAGAVGTPPGRSSRRRRSRRRRRGGGGSGPGAPGPSPQRTP